MAVIANTNSVNTSRMKIQDLPLLPSVNGNEKIPTGGFGDYAISVNQIRGGVTVGLADDLALKADKTSVAALSATVSSNVATQLAKDTQQDQAIRQLAESTYSSIGSLTQSINQKPNYQYVIDSVAAVVAGAPPSQDNLKKLANENARLAGLIVNLFDANTNNVAVTTALSSRISNAQLLAETNQLNISDERAVRGSVDLSNTMRGAIQQTMYIEQTVGTMHHFNVPNNASTYTTAGANTGEGGLTVNVTGSTGATVLTSTDTSIVAGFGNTPWPCAIEHTDGTHSFNLVLGDNGSNSITLLNPIKKLAYKLSPKYDAAQGQHLTKRATRAWAEYVYAQREVDCVADKFLDGAWASQPPKYQTLFKKNAALTAYGTVNISNVATLLDNETSGLTPSDSDGYLIRPLPAAAGVMAGLHQIGHGVEMTQQVNGLSGVLESFVGEQKAASGDNGVTITVIGIKNGVESVLYTKSTVRYCVRVVVPFVGFDQIKMKIIANVVGARYIRVTETRIWIGDYANRPIIDKNGNYLAMGDSWFAYYDGEFGKHLQKCMQNDGGVGTVTTKAQGGTTTKHALDWFDSRVQGMQLTGILMHYYTNDLNSAAGNGTFMFPNPQGVTTNYALGSVNEYYALMSTLVTRAKSIGVAPIVFRAGGTASSAQSQHQQNAGRFIAQGVWSNPDRQSLPDELADSTAFINVYGKSRGSRTLVGDSPVYALGNSPSSAWSDNVGKRVGGLESIVYDFSASAVGSFTIGTDTDSDGLSNGVVQTTFGVTTGITATNSIVAGKQKLSVAFNNAASSGGFRQRYQYTSIAGHRYVLIMVLEGCTPSKPFEFLYTVPAGTTAATTTPTDGAGNAVAAVTVTQTASAVQSIYVSLTNPMAVAALDTVVKSLYIIDATAFDATYGTTYATLPDADVIAIMRAQLLRDLPTTVRLRDSATGVTRKISVNNGAITVV